MNTSFSKNQPPPLPFHLKKSKSRFNNRYDMDSSFSCLRSSKSPSLRMTTKDVLNVTLPNLTRDKVNLEKRKPKKKRKRR